MIVHDMGCNLSCKKGRSFEKEVSALSSQREGDLVNDFAVEADVETFDFFLRRDAQAKEDLGDHQ